MAPKTNLGCGGAHLERIETQVTRAALIQKIDCLAVLFMNSHAREFTIVAWSPALNRPSFLYPGYKIGDGQQQLQMIVSSRKRSDEQSAAEKAWKAQEPRALRRDGSEDLNRGDPSGQTWDEGGLSRRRNS